jgi:hypothetical protein
MGELKPPGKPFGISKLEVWEAYQKVKANKGAPGVDEVTLGDFESDLKNNLYKIWNRMYRPTRHSGRGDLNPRGREPDPVCGGSAGEASRAQDCSVKHGRGGASVADSCGDAGPESWAMRLWADEREACHPVPVARRHQGRGIQSLIGEQVQRVALVGHLLPEGSPAGAHGPRMHAT